MDVLFATAELSPFVKVGGLGDASSGLTRALRDEGLTVLVVIPDYGGLPLLTQREFTLDVPGWAAPATARIGLLDGFDSVALVDVPGMARPHPYLDPDGMGWADNDRRFFAFSAGVAALSEVLDPDVLHLNDWHTGTVLGFLERDLASVLTIHNLAYQGNAPGSWLDLIPSHSDAYEWYTGTNPLAGAITLADGVVTVSPTFAREALEPETGFGIHEVLSAKGSGFSGILNGIEVDVWDPVTDAHLPIGYEAETATRKRRIAAQLSRELGWEPVNEPMIGMVTRLTDQKGVDIALGAAERLDDFGARMILLGSGERGLADAATALARRIPDRFAFRTGYDERLAHMIFAASDLYLMPSRFEPGGLTQMQAMRYGSIPVVTDVGGLHDTVIDADLDPERGTGFVAPRASVDSVAEALGRAVRAWRSTRRRGAIRRRIMALDWSWAGPARRYIELYREVTAAR